MTYEEASKIVNIWGKYLEHTFGRLNTLFMGKIPESLLPYNKTVLDEALNIMDKYYLDTGNKRGMELMRETSMLLELYHDDDEMLQNAGQMFNDQDQRERIVASIKDWQNTWSTTQ